MGGAGARSPRWAPVPVRRTHRDRLKILYWYKDEFCIWYKRLEEGTFRLPSFKKVGTCVELKASELAMLLAGIDLTSIKRRKRFARSA